MTSYGRRGALPALQPVAATAARKSRGRTALVSFYEYTSCSVIFGIPTASRALVYQSGAGPFLRVGLKG